MHTSTLASDGGSARAPARSLSARLERAEATGRISERARLRLERLDKVLLECQGQGLLTFMVPEAASEACILGWSGMLVHAPAQFCAKIREMVEMDPARVWVWRADGVSQTLKRPTWVVYELLRKIGVKPSRRGLRGAEGDPGSGDMLYYERWDFRNDYSFQNPRQCLATSGSMGARTGRSTGRQ